MATGERQRPAMAANSNALQSGASLESHYVIHPGLAIRIVTDAQRSATVIVLPSED